MKLKTFSLFLGLLCSNVLWAQNPEMELSDVKTVETGDSVVLTMGVQVDMEKMPSRNQLRLVPVLKMGSKSVDLTPVVLLNGKKMHAMYKRQAILEKRKAGNSYVNREQAFEYKGGKFDLNYRGAVALAMGNKSADVYVRRQLLDEDGKVLQNELVAGRVAAAGGAGVTRVQPQRTSVGADLSTGGTVDGAGDGSVLGEKANDVVDLQQDFSVVYKGSYIQPASDAIFERNQKELRFSLDEAKVIAEINPHMLSLRELYAVARSYEARPAMFHKIIKKSVELYPSNPIANLNAAASAIELRDVDAAAIYLQAAPHDTLAYVNCKGAYELMKNNVQEGLRLLKSAAASGSKEATENLKIFFSSFKEIQ